MALERTRLATIAEQRQVTITKVAYSLRDLTKVTGLSYPALQRRVQNSTLRALQAGKQYVTTKAAVVAAGLRGAATLLDHHEIIDPVVAYSVHEVADFLGVPYRAALRLVNIGRIAARRNPVGGRATVLGAALLDYLDGADEPMRHPESA